MADNQRDFHGRLGRTWSREFTILDANGSPQNLTGYGATFTVTDQDGVVTTVTKTIGSGITVTVATGILVVTLSATDACIAAEGTYWWDLKLTDGSSRPWNGAPDPPWRGTLTVSP